MKKSALFFIIVLIVLLGMHFFVYNEEFSVKTIMVSVVASIISTLLYWAVSKFFAKKG